MRFQTQLHLLHNLEEVGTGAVHLVHKGQARHLVLVGLTPDGFRLRLHAAHGAIHHASTVKNAHRTLHFDGEVDVAGGIDDVDPVFGKVIFHAFPETGGRSGRDRDATLLLLLHPVHGGRTVVHFSDLVVHTGLEQNPLGSGCLAGVNMSGNTNVAVALNGGMASHDESLVDLCLQTARRAMRRSVRPSNRMQSCGRCQQHRDGPQQRMKVAQ